MSIWQPWDADEEEAAEWSIIREDLPPELEEAMVHWLIGQMQVEANDYTWVNMETAMRLQTALRTDLGIAAGVATTQRELVTGLRNAGPKYVLRAVDWFLQRIKQPPFVEAEPESVSSLRYHLDHGNSAAQVIRNEGWGDDTTWKLGRRVPVGVEQVVQEAVASGGAAGQLLARAWTAAYGFEPNPGEAMQLAVRAVEAAGRQTVVPRSKKGFIGEMAQVIEDQAGWELILWRDAEGFPDHSKMLSLMLRTLAKAQSNRHGEGHSEPTAAEARAHVQLAATLVAWFAAGSILPPTSA